jgi:hypothetical protein
MSNEGFLLGNWKTCIHAENVNVHSKRNTLGYTQTNREVSRDAGIYICKCIHRWAGRQTDRRTVEWI